MGASYQEQGETKLKDRVTTESFAELFNKAEVEAASLHKPGSELTLPNGKRYIVRTDGSWAQVVSSPDDECQTGDPKS